RDVIVDPFFIIDRRRLLIDVDALIAVVAIRAPVAVFVLAMRARMLPGLRGDLQVRGARGRERCGVEPGDRERGGREKREQNSTHSILQVAHRLRNLVKEVVMRGAGWNKKKPRFRRGFRDQSYQRSK